MRSPLIPLARFALNDRKRRSGLRQLGQTSNATSVTLNGVTVWTTTAPITFNPDRRTPTTYCGRVGRAARQRRRDRWKSRRLQPIPKL